MHQVFPRVTICSRNLGNLQAKQLFSIELGVQWVFCNAISVWVLVHSHLDGEEGADVCVFCDGLGEDTHRELHCVAIDVLHLNTRLTSMISQGPQSNTSNSGKHFSSSNRLWQSISVFIFTCTHCTLVQHCPWCQTHYLPTPYLQAIVHEEGYCSQSHVCHKHNLPTLWRWKQYHGMTSFGVKSVRYFMVYLSL